MMDVKDLVEKVLVCSWVLVFIGAFIIHEIQLSEYGKNEKPLTKVALKILIGIVVIMIISFILFFHFYE